MDVMNKYIYFRRLIRVVIGFIVEIALIPIIISFAVAANFIKKKIDIGIGPEPLINNIYHSKALKAKGYSVETFVNHVYYITENFDRVLFCKSSRIVRIFSSLLCLLFFSVIFRYRALYIYFNGGALLGTILLWRIEPWLYKLAGIKIVVMPYGGDVQDLTRCPNTAFRHSVGLDYPQHRKVRRKIDAKLDLWINNADHVISGCDWVDYMHYWDTLMLSHFSIDMRELKCNYEIWSQARPLKILHAPNHPNIKGTKFLLDAVEGLRAEGFSIELIIANSVANERIRELIDTVDLVADQLIIGWYAMFSIEAMSAGKPVICYLRKDLLHFYEDVGLVNNCEIPIIQASVRDIKDVIRGLMINPELLHEAAKKGPVYVEKHHSLESVGKIFDSINRRIGIFPSVDLSAKL